MSTPFIVDVRDKRQFSGGSSILLRDNAGDGLASLRSACGAETIVERAIARIRIDPSFASILLARSRAGSAPRSAILALRPFARSNDRALRVGAPRSSPSPVYRRKDRPLNGALFLRRVSIRSPDRVDVGCSASRNAHQIALMWVAARLETLTRSRFSPRCLTTPCRGRVWTLALGIIVIPRSRAASHAEARILRASPGWRSYDRALRAARAGSRPVPGL
jgi:hypothetical protein